MRSGSSERVGVTGEAAQLVRRLTGATRSRLFTDEEAAALSR
jgi:hypothetical protein